MSRGAYVLIDAERGKTMDVVLALSGKPGILTAEPILGPHDVIAVIEANNVDALAHVVETEIAAVEGILRTDTCLVISGHQENLN